MDAEVAPAVTGEQAAEARWSRYLKAWLAATGLLLLLVAGLNAAVDPFFVFGAPLIPGFNRYKPATQGREALAKPALLPRMQPHTVLIGTSKVQVGLDPTSPIWQPEDQPVFNAGLPGSTSAATLAALDGALALAPVQRVLVLLEPMDLLELATAWTEPEPFRHTGWARLRDLVDAVLTRDATEASLRTLAGQWTALPSGLRPNGQMYDGAFREPTAAEGPGVMFGQKMPPNALRVARLARRLAGQPDAAIAQLDVVRRIIAECQERNVALDLALAPVHADMLRLVDLAGLWPRYLRMRDELAQTVASSGGGRIRLWNFTGFDSYSTEPVPPLGHPAPALRWFWEPNHFRPELGELLLSTIYGRRTAAGALLSPTELAAGDQAQTTAMERDRAEQPEEWARAAAALRKEGS